MKLLACSSFARRAGLVAALVAGVAVPGATPKLLAQCQSNPMPGAKTTVTSSCSETDTIVATTGTTSVTSYNTTITAELGSGAYVYDETFTQPYGSSIVQMAVATAEADLLAAGASSYTGPTETADATSTSTSTSTTSTSTFVDTVYGTSTTFGPGVIVINNLGVCAGLAPGMNGPEPYGCTGGTLFTVAAGTINININADSEYDLNDVTILTTNTLTSQTYNLSGSTVVTSQTPEPSTLALLGTGIAGLGGAIRRRRR